MTDPTSEPRATERLAVAALDHHLAALGYAAVPDPRPEGGGWRRLYMGAGPASVVSAVGPAIGAWCSLGVEFPARREAALGRMEALLEALAPYEVAIDLDAGGARTGADVSVRIALRVFVEGLTGAVVRDVLDNVAEAAEVAKRVLSA
jgi:hypothetical protein